MALSADVTIGTGSSSDKDALSPQDGRFWLSEVGEPVHHKVFPWAKTLKDVWRPLARLDYEHDTIYENRALQSSARYLPGMRALKAAGFDTSRLFVTTSIVDTFVARISKRRSMPMFVVDDAEWELKQKAQDFRRWLHGKLLETEVDRLGADIVRDAEVRGTGVLYTDDGPNDIIVERVHRSEILLDPHEAKQGARAVRTLYRFRQIGRDALIAQFPEHRKAIEEAPEAEDDQYRYGDRLADHSKMGRRDVVDYVEVWHLPTEVPLEYAEDDEPENDNEAEEKPKKRRRAADDEYGYGEDVDERDDEERDSDEDEPAKPKRKKQAQAQGGRVACCIANATLYHQEWKQPRFPFQFLHRHRPQDGFWGTGTVERLRGQQAELNRMVADISMNVHVTGKGIWMTSAPAQIQPEQLSGYRPLVLSLPGGSPQPQFVHPPPVGPATIDLLDRKISWMHDLVGAAQWSAQGRSPLGAGASGVAIDTMEDLLSDRHSVFEADYGHFRLDASQGQLDAGNRLNDRIKASGKKRGFRSSWLDKGALTNLDWDACAIDEDQYRLQLEPTNFLPSTRAGKLAATAELVGKGVIPQEYAATLYDEPDIAHVNRILLAERKNCERLVDQVGRLDKPLPGVDEWHPLDMLLDYTKKYFNRAETELERAPEDVRERVLMRYREFGDLVLSAIELKNKGSAAPPGPEGMPPPGAAMPPGMPGAPMPPDAGMMPPGMPPGPEGAMPPIDPSMMPPVAA